MAWTTDDLTILQKAIAQGALSVEYADKKVEYRSLSEMLQIMGMMQNELGATKDNGRRVGVYEKGV